MLSREKVRELLGPKCQLNEADLGAMREEMYRLVRLAMTTDLDHPPPPVDPEPCDE